MTAPPNPPQPLLRLSANHLRPADETDGLGKVLAWNPVQLITGGFGYLADGGHLLIWPNGVSFEPHSMNLPGGQWWAPAETIRVVRTFSQQALKGLEIELQDGATRRFVVGDRENVLETLRALGLPTG
ncbi:MULTISPECIES: hypothetical protein [Kocuria]|uniref:hypothetical protein n=1 Tax=Kocuria TaxID=57493 RepID=UPI0010F76A4A|nr:MULTISPECIES: hypothetical protein [Kocuria]MCM3331559.1 hypothetical protein [Kocuria palustris]MCY1683019.1 hypothetical protein [Kocuria sp. SL71]GLU86176.1 hypothetical protein Kosp01_09220 [Kocuria sp. NBRC 114282]